MIQIGSLVDGKYKVLSEIGHGGMSTVYLARNERANKNWAIKEVRKNATVDYDTVRQGLIAETDILKKLDHPRLPSIIDIINDDDSFVIVMDFIEGKDLGDRLKTSGPQPWRDVVEWAKQLCDVLAYLHSRRPNPIIYRDMKPANIMLKPDGNIMLMDFGTAREYKSNRAGDDTTCLGTRGYAAPEQFGGHGQTDARTDIYCLGATMYHLLTGLPPLAPPHYKMLPIRQINPQLPHGLEEVILKCTKQNPQERYQNCAELMYALEHDVIEGEKRWKRKLKRKVQLWAGCTAAAVALAAAGGGFGMAANKISDAAYVSTMKEALSEFENTGISAEDTAYISIESGLKDAIEIKPGDKRAWIYLTRLYRSNQVVTEQERQSIVNLIHTYGKELEKKDAEYAQFCLEWGTDLFFFYDKDLDVTLGAGQPTQAIDELSFVVGDADNGTDTYIKRLMNEDSDAVTTKSLMQIAKVDELTARSNYQLAVDMQKIAVNAGQLGKRKGAGAASALAADNYTYANYFNDLTALMNDDTLLQSSNTGSVGVQGEYFVCAIYNNVISAVNLHMEDMVNDGVTVDQIEDIIRLVEQKKNALSASKDTQALRNNIDSQISLASGDKLESIR